MPAAAAVPLLDIAGIRGYLEALAAVSGYEFRIAVAQQDASPLLVELTMAGKLLDVRTFVGSRVNDVEALAAVCRDDEEEATANALHAPLLVAHAKAGGLYDIRVVGLTASGNGHTSAAVLGNE